MGLSYADAVLLMGGKQNRTVAKIDALLGGALLASSAVTGGFVLGIFDARNELAKLSYELIRNVGQRIQGLDRYSSSQRLVAAHAVIALASYFETLAQADLPIDRSRLKLTKGEQVAMAGGGPPGPGRFLGALADGLLRTEVPMPAPDRPFELVLEDMKVFYQGLSAEVARCLAGLSGQQKLSETLTEQFLNRAVDCYAWHFRQLAVDFPEMDIWANQVDHQATRAGLAVLKQMLSDLADNRISDERRLSLYRAYQGVLSRPVLTTSDAPPGLTLPLLGDAYVVPDFKEVQVTEKVAHEISNESWWEDQPVRDDLEEFLADHLKSPQSVQTPLLIFGQPGSGKSALTQMLAAYLPPTSYLAVRVVLREVAVDADLQSQIEEAIRTATGENLAWPDLVRSAEGARPVVLLDGFDELLQATGVSRTDYIEKVAAFQGREAVLGRPVAILITSRTAVADRSTPTPGTKVVRLEPFREVQIRQWVSVWNQANEEAFANRNLAPLAAQTVLNHIELASQPLLLTMLALYDGDGNRLQQATDALNESELYERLLAGFAEREVRKSRPGLSEEAIQDAVEVELLRLSVVGLAMFTRSRQWVTEAELDNDLPALLGEGGDQAVPRGLRAPLTAAQVVVGRFFFVHEAQATRDNTRLHSYEFLHATFAEYLIARLIVNELADLTDTALLSASRARREPLDDSFLYALLSYMPITMRSTIVAFAAEWIWELIPERRQRLYSLLLDLFGSALAQRHETRYSDYLPIQATVTARTASYSANLVMLAVLAGGGVTAGELFPGARDPVAEWGSLAMLWRSQLPSEGWEGMLYSFALERMWSGDGRDIELRYERAPVVSARHIDPYWSCNRPWNEPYRARRLPFGWNRKIDSSIRRQAWFLCDEDGDVMMHALSPLEDAMDGVISSFHSYWPDDDHAISTGNALMRLLLIASRDCHQDALAAELETCLEIAIRARFGSNQSRVRKIFRQTVIRQLAASQGRVSEEWYLGAIQQIREAGSKDSREAYDAEELLQVAADLIPGFSVNA